MTRRARTTLQRARLFEDHRGRCHICECKIQVGEKWEVEHVIPLEIGGDDSDDNLAPAHVKCHKAKTKADARDIAKCRRVAAKHKGAKTARNPLGSRKWKKKVDGSVVPR